MDAVLPIAVWATIILTGLGILAILLFGLRGLVYGKVDPISVVIIIVPVVLFVVLGFAMGWALGAMWTVLIMFALAMLALLLTGVRSLFT